ncbi:hypothetical protein GCM10022221_32240 [Actinocorallia aurea]
MPRPAASDARPATGEGAGDAFSEAASSGAASAGSARRGVPPRRTASAGAAPRRSVPPPRDRPELLPFTGVLPQVAEGDLVWCRDALGRGWTRRVALDGPRYDQAGAHRTCRLTVPTASVRDWHDHASAAPFVNWPAEDVARADRPVPGPIMAAAHRP